uniref:Paramyosin n=1 Tax=Ascaris lumbricoides TaxID=6252 RepID=A0A0M3IVK4_ASCLU
MTVTACCFSEYSESWFPFGSSRTATSNRKCGSKDPRASDAETMTVTAWCFSEYSESWFPFGSSRTATSNRKCGSKDPRASDAETASFDSETKQEADISRLRRKLESSISQLETALDLANRGNNDAVKKVDENHDQIAELQRQASFDSETKQEADISRLRRKLESSISQLETALDLANRGNSDAVKKVDENHDQIAELQRQVSLCAIIQLAASFDSETKQEADISRLRRKLESSISQLETALDLANRGNNDAVKKVDENHDQIAELQRQVSLCEEQHYRENILEQYLNMKKCATELQSKKEELVIAVDEAVRSGQQAGRDAHQSVSRCDGLTAEAHSLSAIGHKVDNELVEIHKHLDQTLNELRSCGERSKAAMAHAGRLVEQTRHLQESAMQNERVRKSLEAQLKEMQV